MVIRELRVGNSIHWQGMEFKVSIVEDNDITPMVHCYFNPKYPEYHLEGVPLKEFDPIPLTEEWLKKFGFWEKYKSSSNRWYKRAESLNAGCELHDCEDENTGKLKGVFLHDFSIEIMYVHQLQNLYFALTEEELKCTNDTYLPDEK